MSHLFQIISDGACDLTPETAETNQIKMVPFYVSFDKEHYFKEVEEVKVRDLGRRHEP